MSQSAKLRVSGATEPVANWKQLVCKCGCVCLTFAGAKVTPRLNSEFRSEAFVARVMRCP